LSPSTSVSIANMKRFSSAKKRQAEGSSSM
jgi:hypothetical protein